MSELGDTFNALRKDGQERRERNRKSSPEVLTAAGVGYTAKNHGSHLIITHGDQVVDFWPGTGLFIPRKDQRRRRGVYTLLRYLGVKAP